MARVIRARAELVRGEIVSAKARAAQIVAEAEQAAARLRAEAASEIASAKRDAIEEGRREGRALTAALEARAAEARDRSVAEAEHVVVGLVTKIAERVLHGVLEDAPERVVPAVRAELARVRRAKTVEIRLHPDDAEAVRAALARGETLEPAAPHLVPDPTIVRGGCLVSSDLGTLDARLEVQLEAFARALRETR
ncbi:MAG: type III secretion system stator protein SctL [Sandaracinus sp.]